VGPVLLATDGSPSAAEACRTAIELAATFGVGLATIAVTHVEPPLRASHSYPELHERLVRLEQRRLAAVLAETAAAASDAGVRCELVGGTGLVVDEVFRAARERAARMIVVGAHGWGPLGRVLHGSVSGSLLDDPPCPVLVVRGEPRQPAEKGGVMRPVMLATDGSASAEAATQEAIELAHAFDAPLVVLAVAHASVPAYGAGYVGYGDLVAELRNTEIAHVEDVLARTRARATEAGVRCETVALEGMPGDEICREAARREPRLVIVGAHGWGRFGRIVHGSVSTHVLHHAPCPVLVVRGEEPTAVEQELPAGHAVA
jgi:nucleotide-binding universal stress UspA family protein